MLLCVCIILYPIFDSLKICKASVYCEPPMQTKFQNDSSFFSLLSLVVYTLSQKNLGVLFCSDLNFSEEVDKGNGSCGGLSTMDSKPKCFQKNIVWNQSNKKCL